MADNNDNPQKCVKNLVLGAGIAGLAFASHVQEPDTVIFEKEDTYGGLCRSYHVNGFIFDTAVHLSFTQTPEVRKCFDQTPFLMHDPISYNYYHSYWLKHPVIFNLAPLPTEDKVNLARSYIEDRYTGPINNYYELLLQTYGSLITEKFYNVYTQKYWTIDSKELSTAWTGDRIHRPDLKKILKGLFEMQRESDYYAQEMRYPKEGSYQAFLKPMAEKARICCHKEAVKVDAPKKSVCFSDGTIVQYQRLISSIPIPELIRILEDVPEDIKALSKQLMASSISIVSVGFNRADIPKWLWFYIYDGDILASRVNAPSIKTPANAPAGLSSMQFEIYHKHGETINRDLVLDNVRYALNKMKICEPKDILFMEHRTVPYGNVIFFNGMEDIRDRVKRYLEAQGIILIGRFGEWDYLWSDQSFMSGFRAAKKL